VNPWGDKVVDPPKRYDMPVAVQITDAPGVNGNAYIPVPQPSGILALDLATATGWACSNGDSGVQRFQLKRGDSPGMRFLRFSSWLHEILDLTSPALVVVEQAHHRGGHATELAVGFSTRVQEQAARRGINFTSVHSATLKKHATGSGRANKQDMIDAARVILEREPLDDNEADAVLILQWAKEQYRG